MNYEATLRKTRELVEKHVDFFDKNTYEISILPGWAELVEFFLQEVKNLTKDSEGKIKISQIKEKLGGLRIYYRTVNLSEKQKQEVGALVEKVEASSYNTCNICSKPGRPENRIGWISVRCKDHKDADVFTEDYSLSVLGKHDDEMARILRHDL